MNDLQNNLFTMLKKLGVDVDGTISRFMNNSDIYYKFLSRFPDEDRITPIKDAVAQRDYEKLLQASHKLKGVSANLGMSDLSSKAERIVKKLRSNIYEGFEADTAEVETAYELICATIKEYI